MKTEHIGSRGTLFIFDELLADYGCQTSVYVIAGKEWFFFCDTYLGADYIAEMQRYLTKRFGRKKSAAFNSHYDWDHVWGNAAFAESALYASAATRAALQQRWQEQYNANRKLARIEIEQRLPGVLFEERLTLAAEGVELFTSPGHTADSSSCYDRVDSVLYVGDNLELPQPQFEDCAVIPAYIKTLEHYKLLNPCYIVAAHGGLLPSAVIDDNLEYLRSLFGR